MSPQLHCANGASIFLGNPDTTSKLGAFHKNGGASGWQKLPFIHDPQCLSCARALTHPGICGQCQQGPTVDDSAIAPLAYDNPVNEMLQALKYRQHLSFARPIAGVTVDAVVTQRQKRPDMLCAVPITSRTL